MQPTSQNTLYLRHLGRRDYRETWQAMRVFTDARNADTPDEIWIVEHPPVYTQGVAGKSEHVLDAGSVPLVHSDRGGQVTYHGPGQLVLYTLLDLRRLNRSVKVIVNALEQAVIATLRQYGIKAELREGAPGVYVDGKKIASLGLRVRHNRCYHGLSLNVDMDLEPFNRINPCGYPGLAVTQLAEFSVAASYIDPAMPIIRYLAEELGYANLAYAGNHSPQAE